MKKGLSVIAGLVGVNSDCFVEKELDLKFCIRSLMRKFIVSKGEKGLKFL